MSEPPLKKHKVEDNQQENQNSMYKRRYFLNLFGNLEKWNSENVLKWSKLYHNGKFLELSKKWPFLDGYDISNMTKSDFALVLPSIGEELFIEFDKLKITIENIQPDPKSVKIARTNVRLENWTKDQFQKWLKVDCEGKFESISSKLKNLDGKIICSIFDKESFLSYLNDKLNEDSNSQLSDQHDLQLDLWNQIQMLKAAFTIHSSSYLEDILKLMESIEIEKPIQNFEEPTFEFELGNREELYTPLFDNFKNRYASHFEERCSKYDYWLDSIYGPKGVGKTRFVSELLNVFKDLNLKNEKQDSFSFRYYGKETKQQLMVDLPKTTTILMDLKNGDFEIQQWELEWLSIECFLGVRLFILYFCPKKSFKKCLEKLEQFYDLEPKRFVQIFEIGCVLDAISNCTVEGSHYSGIKRNYEPFAEGENTILKPLDLDPNLEYKPPTILHLIIDEIQHIEILSENAGGSIAHLLVDLAMHTPNSMFFYPIICGEKFYLDHHQDIQVAVYRLRGLEFDISKKLVEKTVLEIDSFQQIMKEAANRRLFHKMVALCCGYPKSLELLSKIILENVKNLKDTQNNNINLNSISLSDIFDLFLKRISFPNRKDWFENETEIIRNNFPLLIAFLGGVRLEYGDWTHNNRSGMKWGFGRNQLGTNIPLEFEKFWYGRDSFYIIRMPIILASKLLREFERKPGVEKLMELNDQILNASNSLRLKSTTDDDISMICLNHFATKLLVSELLISYQTNSLFITHYIRFFQGCFFSSRRLERIPLQTLSIDDQNFKIEKVLNESKLEEILMQNPNNNSIGFQFNGETKLMNGVFKLNLADMKGENLENCLIWIDLAFSLNSEFNENDLNNSIEKRNKINKKFPKHRNIVFILSNLKCNDDLKRKFDEAMNSKKVENSNLEDIILASDDLCDSVRIETRDWPKFQPLKLRGWDLLFGETNANLMRSIVQNLD